jgi:hypothetical protein
MVAEVARHRQCTHAEPAHVAERHGHDWIGMVQGEHTFIKSVSFGVVYRLAMEGGQGLRM